MQSANHIAYKGLFLRILMISWPPADNSLMKAFINKLLSIYLYICYNGVDESKWVKY
jgi:uncharacterized protein YggT (Ycf19 family)